MRARLPNISPWAHQLSHCRIGPIPNKAPFVPRAPVLCRVVLDVDPATNSWRLDKDGNILIRTVNEVSFESTYNRINDC